MFFKKKNNETFEIKTEEENFENNYDKDFFRYEDEDSLIIEPYKAKKVKEETNEEVYKTVETTTYHKEEIPTTDDKYETEYSYEEVKPKHRFYLSDRLLYILNRIASIVLIITTVIAVIVLFDVIMLTRFEKGPFFAIKTKTYKDGTKVYHGIGYKVIKSKNNMIVGNYSITYSK